MNRFRIVIDDLKISMFLGIHDFEKESPQTVLIHAEIDVCIDAPSASGILDYDKVVGFIRGFAMRSIETQEELVKEIHDFVMSLGAESAVIYSRKPDIFDDCKSVGVSFRG